MQGLPSYVENFRGLTVGVDLLATMYAGFNAYAEMAGLTGDDVKMTKGRIQAEAYREILENRWWNPDSSFYQTFWTEDQKFHRGKEFLLFFGLTRLKIRTAFVPA